MSEAHAHAVESPEAPFDRRRFALYSGLALLFALAVYSNCLQNGFHLDDNSFIVYNGYVRSLHNIPAIFSSGTTYSVMPSMATYRPLTTTLFAFDYWLADGLNPVGFHAVHLLIHLFNATLVGLIIIRSQHVSGFAAPSPWFGLCGALLFAVHRANSESVNYLAAVSELLAATGLLASLLLFIRAPGVRGAHLWWLPMIAGTLSKQTALMAPLLALAWHATCAGADIQTEPDARTARRVRFAIRFMPAFAVAGGLYLLQARLTGPMMFWSGYSPRIYLQSQTFAWLHYFTLFLIPTGLSFDYNWPPIWNAGDPRLLAGIAFTTTLLGGALFYRLKSPRYGRLFLFGALWFFIALLPSSSFFPAGDIVHDYRSYPAYPGLVLCAGAVAADFWRRTAARGRFAITSVAVLAILLNGYGTYRRNFEWRTELSLWQSTVAVSPGSARAWIGLARAHLGNDELEKAAECLMNAKRLAPVYSTVDIGLATLAMKEKRWDDAERWLLTARKNDPSDANAIMELANLAMQRGDADKAIENYRLGLSLAPANRQARTALLDLYARRGDWPGYCRLRADSAAMGLVPEAGEPGALHCRASNPRGSP